MTDTSTRYRALSTAEHKRRLIEAEETGKSIATGVALIAIVFLLFLIVSPAKAAEAAEAVTLGQMIGRGFLFVVAGWIATGLLIAAWAIFTAPDMPDEDRS